jgi:hypothetical protein
MAGQAARNAPTDWSPLRAPAFPCGVNRVTVYRHCPDARTLLEACSLHARRLNPAPRSGRLATNRGPTAPRRGSTHAVLRLLPPHRGRLANVLRDAELAPPVKEMAEERRLAYLRQVRDVLLAGWRVRGARRALLRAVLGLAVDFRTWQTLARREGLDDRTAVALIVHLTACVGGR